MSSFELLAAMPGLGAAATLVRAAHERFDGSGHPRGLSGLEIPMGATARSPSPAPSIASPPASRGVPASAVRRADARLEALAGTALDPDLVRVWAGHADRVLAAG